MFHCGVRRFAACPVFSQHTAGDKHKVRIYICMNIHKIDFVDNVYICTFYVYTNIHKIDFVDNVYICTFYVYTNIHKIDFVDNVLCILLPYLTYSLRDISRVVRWPWQQCSLQLATHPSQF